MSSLSSLRPQKEFQKWGGGVVKRSDDAIKELQRWHGLVMISRIWRLDAWNEGEGPP